MPRVSRPALVIKNKMRAALPSRGNRYMYNYSMSNRKIILHGERVALAEMLAEDQPFFRKWLSENAGLRELIDDLKIPTAEDQSNWFKRVQKPDRKFFSLVTVPDEKLIGNAGFVDIDEDRKTATMRITIGHPEFLGKGLGSEAIGLLKKYAFESADFEKLGLKVLENNLRAVKSYMKSGFKLIGKESIDGKIKLTMALSRSDYFKSQS